jgi:site-specific recombinase XerD
MSESESAAKPHKPTNIRNLFHYQGRYYARYWDGLKEKKKTLKTADLKVARKRLKEFMVGINARRAGFEIDGPEKPKVTWEQMRAAYMGSEGWKGLTPKTRTRYLIDLPRIGSFLADSGRSPADVTLRDVTSFIAELRDRNLSSSSVKNALTTFSQVWEAGKEAGLVEANIVAEYSRRSLRSNARMNPPLNGEFERMLPEVQALAPEFYYFVQWLHETGCRATEALLVEATDLRSDGTVFLHRGVKRDRWRTIRLNRATELLQYLPKRGRLFPHLSPVVQNVSSDWGAFFDKRQQAEEAAAAMVGREPDAWKLRRWRLHDHRHGFAINAVQEGADIYLLSGHLGHRSVKTTEVYLEAIKQLPVELRRGLTLRARNRANGTFRTDWREMDQPVIPHHVSLSDPITEAEERARMRQG